MYTFDKIIYLNLDKQGGLAAMLSILLVEHQSERTYIIITPNFILNLDDQLGKQFIRSLSIKILNPNSNTMINTGASYSIESFADRQCC